MIPLRDFALAPVSVLYGVVARARLDIYRRGILPTERVGVPVLSVGNLTAGGTGKTPLVAWIAREVAREGLRVCILTRGYGRSEARKRVVVSDGEHLFADARTGGDEPQLLAESLRGVAAVISDADRVAAARWALEHLGSEVFILDDGFQHLRLARDLNILTLDASDPWGGEHLLPRGRLREPLGEMRRADVIVITRAELATDIELLRTRADILSGGNLPVLIARTKTRRITRLDEMMSVSPVAVETLEQPLAAFCALGNPRAFFTHARKEGFALCHTRAYTDHHAYTQREIDGFMVEAVQRGARGLLTTAKDAVKIRALNFALPCYVLEVELSFDDEEAMRALLREAIHLTHARTNL